MNSIKKEKNPFPLVSLRETKDKKVENLYQIILNKIYSNFIKSPSIITMVSAHPMGFVFNYLRNSTFNSKYILGRNI